MPAQFRRLSIRRAAAMMVMVMGLQGTVAWAQGASASTSDNPATLTLHSKVLGEDRTIQVFLPTGYRSGAPQRYDVVYVLDGEMLARFFPPIRAFDEENDLIPPVIIVGVNNMYWYDKGLDSRDRDLLPAPVAGSPLSGKADKFIDFLSSELVPFIAKHYTTTGEATLFGHSYGGLFTIYTLLTRPDAFAHYIASDPALWWNGGYVSKLAAERLPHLSVRRTTLFVGGRSGQMYEAFGIKAMVALLQDKAPTTLRWKSTANEDEDHGSVRLKNIHDGLKFTYFGHGGSMIDIFPNDGILLRGKPVAIFNYSTYLGETPGIRYTTDGSEPTARSARYDYGIRVSAPARLTVKQFSNWGPDKTTTGRFVIGKALSPVALPSGVAPGGLDWALYDGDGLDLDHLTPRKFGRAEAAFDVSRLGGVAPFAVRLEGYFKAEQAGYHIFFVESDAIANLYVDGQPLIRIDVSRDKVGARSFVVPLGKGFHSLRIDYSHPAGDKRLAVTYLPPGTQNDPLARLPIAIPAALLYGSAKAGADADASRVR